MAVIEVSGLHKRYGDVHAVRGVSFEVEQGDVFALLGPNGAGKSTTVEILEGHRAQSDGHVSVLGVDPQTGGRAFRDRIGIVLQQTGIETELSVIEALELYASAYQDPADPAEVLAMVGLEGNEDRRVRQLSGGQQRRIDLALGVIGKPDVLFLDEPTTGFDPSARRKSWDLVSGLRSLGTTILLTTHYMDEAQHLADRVAVIVGGEIVASGTPTELMDATGETVISFVAPRSGLDGLDLAGVMVTGGVTTIRTATPTATLHRLTAWAVDGGVELHELTVDRPSLEDVYLQLAADHESVD